MFRYPRGKSPFCTGTEEGGGTGGSGDGGTPIAMKPCAAAGDPGNETGVGEFCSPSGGQCLGNTGASLCLGDFVQESFANRTMICADDSECVGGRVLRPRFTRFAYLKCLIDGGN
jgi:hypothetical protein